LELCVLPKAETLRVTEPQEETVDPVEHVAAGTNTQEVKVL